MLLLVLDVLIVGACAVSPLYLRAVEQSTLRSALTSAARVDRGISVSADAGFDAAAARRRLVDPAVFGSVVGQVDVSASFTVPGRLLVGSLVQRDGQCRHLVMEAGTCPVAGSGVALSSSLAAVLHYGVGSTLRLSVPATGSGSRSAVVGRVVGLYRPFSSDDDYWFDGHYATRAGFTVEQDSVTADAVFASAQLVGSAARVLAAGSADAVPHYSVSVPVRAGRVRLAAVPALRRSVAQLSSAPGASVVTTLPAILDRVDSGRRQARDVVLPLAVALSVLALLVQAVVVGAAADARRAQAGLSRLRGNSRGTVTGDFVIELGALLALAVVPGLLLAWAASAVACAEWLPAGITPELRWPVFAAAAAGVAASVVVATVAGFRSASQPIPAMMRRAPVRITHRRISLGEAMLVVAVGGGLVATLSGGRGDVLALFTVPLLAALMGTIVGRVVLAAAGGAGVRLLRRGWPVSAVASFGVARRPAQRLIVVGVSVAVALAVFASQQWSSGVINRQQRADAVTGAAVVLDADAPSVGALRAAVLAADPSRRWATPVVEVVPPGYGAAATVGIDPASFATIASWGRPALAPSRSLLLRTAVSAGAASTQLPALLAGPAPDTLTSGGGLPISNISGRVVQANVIGRVNFIPGIGTGAVLTDLSTLLRASGGTLDATAHLEVWTRTNDAHREATLTTALRRHGVSVIQRRTAAALRRSYADSAPGWSALFALVMGGLALILAAMIVLLASTARRDRVTDLAAMRSAGLRRAQLRRATTLELGFVAAIAIATGTAAGLLGAHLTLPNVPLFSHGAEVPVPVLHQLDWPWALVAVLSAVVLVSTAIGLLAVKIARVQPSAAWTELP